MRSIRSTVQRIVVYSVGFLSAASLCRADCFLNTYAADKYVIYFDCDSVNQPRLNVIVLDDRLPLKVTGRTPFSNARGVDAFALDGERLILLSWDLVEIYSLKDPAHPTRVVSLRLKNQGAVPGYPRIEKIGGDRYLLLASVGAAELNVNGDASGLKNTALSAGGREKMGEWPPEHRYTYAGDDAVPVRETETFHYELMWKYTNHPGESVSRQYLRRVKKEKGQKAEELLLGARVEPID